MSCQNPTLVETESSSYRLPRTAIPHKYEIRLGPDLEKSVFSGEEIIMFEVKVPLTEIILNALELEIHEAFVTDKKGTKYEGSIFFDEKNERLIIAFSQTLEPGQWQANLKFSGALNDKLHGFYRNIYQDESGKQKVLATTQFEATDARRAFPCWDEPDFKAVFKLTLVIADHLVAISNTGVESEKKLAPKHKEIVFKDTIKMSTYLVAIIVGELESSELVQVNTTPIRVWSVRGKNNLAKFAAEVARHSLAFFENYYGIPYPGDKLDLIAIPNFASGAMENLGAITFRESALLVDEKQASHAELERIADVVAHEIAHMWFGDLTTMSWWNGLWLNEAFATFMEMLAVDAWKPEWKRWDTFCASRAAAFTTDGLASTRPIEFPVKRPEECESMFDVLTYEKGASILRMLEQHLGSEVFAKGIRLYLNRHKFANTQTSDLWDALEEVSQQPVRQLMDSWIFHPGYPVISTELDQSKAQLKLAQQQFSYLPRKQLEKQLFHVPIVLAIGTGSPVKTTFHKLLLSSDKTDIDLGQVPSWVIVNAGGYGFYRVSYSPPLLAGLTKNLFTALNAAERFNLISDTWALVLAGRTSLLSYLQMLMLFQDEADKNVWSAMIGSLIYLERVIEPTVFPQFRSYIVKLVEPAHKRLGWLAKPSEDELTRQLRGMFINTLGTLGKHPPTEEKAREVYAQYQSNKASVEPNIVSALIATLASAGTTTQYEEFFKEFKAAKTPQEEERYLYALAAFHNQELLKQTLDLTLSSQVRTQNAPYLLRSVMLNVAGRELAWNFLKQNWETIISKYPDNSIARMCEGIIALVKLELEQAVKAFFANHPVKQGSKTIEQHQERLRVAVSFKEREQANFGSCFL